MINSRLSLNQKQFSFETYGIKASKDIMKKKVARTLLVHNVLISTLKQSYKKSNISDKRSFSGMICAQKLVKRYRLEALTSRAIGLADRKRLVWEKLEKVKKHKNQIVNSFIRDDVSRNTAGTKETLTRKKVKKQKRFLNASMKILYKKFLREHNANISFTTFIRYRPFWVLKQTDVQRDTCLCRKHENIEFKAKQIEIDSSLI